MSGVAGVAGAMEAVVRLLRASYDADAFDGAVLDFQVYASADFENPMEQGVSLFLYRVYHAGAMRAPPGYTLVGGRQQRARLPLDLHFLATAWARRASLQHEIAGWMVRVLEDHPVLTAELLNAYRPGVFRAEETLVVAPTELATEDVFRIWEVMAERTYQLSVPYVARSVQLESLSSTEPGAPVQERVLKMGVPAPPGSTGRA